jgi:hypothetical protein
MDYDKLEEILELLIAIEPVIFAAVSVDSL